MTARALFLTALLCSSPVLAQEEPPCGPYEDITRSLTNLPYEEVATNVGIMQGYLLELFVNETTGTFTIIMLKPGGLACLMAVGEHWTDLPKSPKGSES